MKRQIIDVTAGLSRAVSSAEHERDASPGARLSIDHDADNRAGLSDMVAAISRGTGFGNFQVLDQLQRRVQGSVPSERLHDFASYLKHSLGFEHLSTISCVDWIAEGRFELVYHFWNYARRILVQAKVSVNRASPSQATVTDLWEPAKFHERDIHEMFGVDFPGCEDLSKYILTDWQGPPPMRKDFRTREFAHEQYHFKEYEPVWDNQVQGGYYSNHAEPDSDAAREIRSGRVASRGSTERWWKENDHE